MLLLLGASLAGAQGLPSSAISPSPRGTAMGGAGVALPADDPFAAFYNPALLAHTSGIHWAHSSSNLVPGLAHEVPLDSRVVTLGVGGLGFEFSGRPFSGWGRSRLDYGSMTLTREGGQSGSDSIGTYASWEEVRQFGFAVDALRMARNLSRLAGFELPDLGDRFELSMGWRWKRYALSLGAVAPAEIGSGIVDTFSAAGTARDWGVLARATPYHNVTGEFRKGEVQSGGRLAAIGGLAVDLYGGFSMLNSHGDSISDGMQSSALPLEKLRRIGAGVRIRTGMPRALQESDFGDVPRLARYLGRTAEFSFGYDAIQDRISEDPPFSFSTAHAVGAELTLVGIVSGRLGHYRDAAGNISGMTSGFGLRLHYADAVSVAYEWATRPQAVGLSDVSIHAWQFLVNPYGLLKAALGG